MPLRSRLIAAASSPVLWASAVSGALHVLLRHHRPRPPLSADGPWLQALLALAPTRALSEWTWLPGLVPGAVIGLMALAAAMATVLHAGGRTTLTAVAAGVGITFVPGLWSEHVAGGDVWPFILLMAAAWRLLHDDGRLTWFVAAASGVAVWLHPSLWLPASIAVLATRGAPSLRVMAATVCVGAACVHAWLAIDDVRPACALAVPTGTVLRGMLIPGGVHGPVGAAGALIDLIGGVRDQITLAGLAVACAWTIPLLGRHPARSAFAPELRRDTSASAPYQGFLCGIVIAVASGLALPAHGAIWMALLAWPVVASALDRLAENVTGWRRTARLVMAAVLLVVLPLASVAVVRPTFIDERDAALLTSAFTGRSAALVVEGPTTLRMARRVGASVVPPDLSAVDACLAAGTRLWTPGHAGSWLRWQGYTLGPAPVDVPLRRLVGAMRPGVSLAFAGAPGAGIWLESADTKFADRLGVARGVALAREAFVAWLPASGRPRLIRSRDDARLDEPADAAERETAALPLPAVSLQANRETATVTVAGHLLVSSRTAAVVLFDRMRTPLLRAALAPTPGLAVSLDTLPALAMARVEGARECLSLTTGTWQTIEADTSRAWLVSPPPAWRDAMVLYLAADADAVVETRTETGPSPVAPGALVTFEDTADRREALTRRLAEDAVPPALALRLSGRVHRIEVPAAAATAPRVRISPVSARAAVMRLPGAAAGIRRDALCLQTFRGRPLLPRSSWSAVDDDTRYRVEVHAGEGWHAPEIAFGPPYRWSAALDATATFDMAEVRPLRLRVTGEPARADGVPSRLDVVLNDHIVIRDLHGHATITLEPSWLRQGSNVLRFQSSRIVQPPGDVRGLAALIRDLRLTRLPER